MRCTDRQRAAGAVLGLGVALLGGCSRQAAQVPAVTGPVVAATSATSPALSSAASVPGSPVVQAMQSRPSVAAAPSAATSSRTPAAPAPRLPPPRPPRHADDLRHQAALRIVAANPNGTYVGRVKEPLLAIPVLQVELTRDGHVARIVVLRAPRQARDTTALAIAAVRRAAPFGDVSHLPPPWRFTETFLFDDARRFKPRSLDE